MSRRKVCLLGLDGVRRDLALEGRGMPHLAALADEGRLHDMTIEGPTVSGPSWSTILTGAGVDDHGVRDNSFLGSRLPRFPDLLSRAFYADQTTTTFAAGDWPPLVDPAGPGPVVFERAEQRRAGLHHLVVRDGERHGYARTDAEVMAHTRHWMAYAAPDVSFVYQCEIDEAGHLEGPHSQLYRDAMAAADDRVRRLVGDLSRRADDGEDWLVVAVTDHGHVDEGGHGGDSAVERASFVVTRRLGGRGEPGWPQHIRPCELSGLVLDHLAGRPAGRSAG